MKDNKFLWVGLLALAALFWSCSDDEDTIIEAPPEEEVQQLQLSANSTEVVVGEEVVFEVTVGAQSIGDAELWADGQRLEGYVHIFEQTGTIAVHAQKEGYENSPSLNLTVVAAEEDPEPDPEPVPLSVDVYVLGYGQHPAESGSWPVVWKNGEPLPLKKEQYGAAVYASDYRGLAVADEQVYLSGSSYLNGSNAAAFYWAGDDFHALTEHQGSNIVGNSGNDIVVDGGDVYVAGVLNTHRNVYNALYWKNGLPVFLTHEEGTDFYSAHGSALAVHNGAVHVAGDRNGSPVWWKEGEAIVLDASGLANSIAVSEQGSVFVGGVAFTDNGERACYWKDGTKIELGNEEYKSEAFAIAVEGEDVYVAGYEARPRSSGSGRVRVACYWKNGVVVDLGDGSYPTQAYGLAVVEGQVFAVGTASKPGEKLSVALWRNGEEFALTDGSEREVASALVVVKRSPL